MSEVLNHTFVEDVTLEAGDILSQPTVAYSTYGKLNEAKDNVIWVCHALTANSRVDEWWSGLFGTGSFYDPDQYFIVCPNNMGSPYGTSSAKMVDPRGRRYGLDFPFFTLRDTALLHIMLMEALGIEEIAMLVGGSCGGNIAQEIAITLGDAVHKMVIMCCSAQETPWVISIHESQRIALHSDPTLTDNTDNAGREGLRGARAFALPFYRSHPSFKIRQGEEDNNKIENFRASSYVRYQGQKFIDRYDAHCYYTQLNALDTHNVGRGRGSIADALSLISAETLVIGFSTDLLIPVIEQQILAEHIPAGTYAEVQTEFGHDAFLIETDQLKELMIPFRS